MKATGIRDGNEIESLLLQTSGSASQLILEEEGDVISAEKNALAFINVQARDQEGLLVPDVEPELSVKLSGPAVLQAAGNAGPLHQGSFTDNTFQLFRGKGMVILRSTGEPGTITVEVSSEGLIPGSVSITAN